MIVVNVANDFCRIILILPSLHILPLYFSENAKLIKGPNHLIFCRWYRRADQQVQNNGVNCFQLSTLQTSLIKAAKL